MARKSKIEATSSVDQPSTPDWPTMVRSRLSDGRIIGADNSVWLYMRVPMSPVEDAKTLSKMLQASEPLINTYYELADMVRSTAGIERRRMVRGAYRDFHLILLNLRSLFSPPFDHEIHDELRNDYHGRQTINRVLLLGVRLNASVNTGGGLKATVDSVMQSLITGGIPLDEYDKDFGRVRTAMTRAGLEPATSDEMRLASAWWNYGLFPDTAIMPEGNCLNIFRTANAARIGKQYAEQGKPSSEWPDIKGHHVISFGAVQDLDLQWSPVTDYRAQWASQLVDNGAVMISVRGKVEPGRITGKEIEAQRKRYIADINERYAAGKLEKIEQQEMLSVLSHVQQIYSTANPPPTLMDTSIIVAFDGVVENMNDLGGPAITLNEMTLRQMRALTESWLCSNTRANPHLLDLPAVTVGHSGIVSLSRVGDPPKGSALLGFTERDRQPAWFNPTAAMDGDSPPLTLVAGASGSGKTVLMQNMADQFARIGRPVVLVDPKQGQDLSPAVEASGGQVISLDDLISSDGILDPLRFSADAEAGIEMAASVLSSVNPWGKQLDDYETPLMVSLRYGVNQGARCTGDALQIAKRDNIAPADMVDKVLALAGANALFRAMVGMNSKSNTALRVSNGVTLIRVGSAHLPLPEPGAPNATLSQRVALSLVRMLVMGSSTAVSYRDGIVFLDEAWVFLSAGHAEVERLGRLARSQRVAVFLLTQRVSDALDADITDFISTGIILPMNKESEAVAACKLLDLEPTAGRIKRILADATQGGMGGSTAPNWNSMRALYEPGTRKVLRGTVGIFADLNDRAVTVEIVVPPAFLAKASTNKADVEARAAAAAADAKPQPPTTPPPGGKPRTRREAKRLQGWSPPPPQKPGVFIPYPDEVGDDTGG